MRVGMGNDGFSNTMWQEWKEAYLLHKLYHRDPQRMGGYTITKIAVENNAALVTDLFDGLQVGEISEGAAADLIFVDYHPFTPMTGGNLPMAYPVWVPGKHGHSDDCGWKALDVPRKLLTLDEAEIAAKAMELSAKIWERFENIATQK
jgi:cytosine/adenosine deaminase-related metal-dependent hydrolase